ncbi:MAG: hypothetical protein KGS09_03875 [Nitrospirae bacterium]|nr:hypothetical protein [Nitrospirota bacterium]
MIALRVLAGFLFTALLSGCYINPFGDSGKQLVDDVHNLKMRLLDIYNNPCLPPGATQTISCYYSLTITKRDQKAGLYKGQVSLKACDQNMRSGNPGENCSKNSYPDSWFAVQGDPDVTNLQMNKDYDFDGQPGFDYLVCRDKNDNPSQKADCAERTTPINAVN